MRRVLPLLLLLPPLGLAACDSAALPPGPDTQGPNSPSAQLVASFPRGGIVDTIVVNAVERLPLRAAELVAPGGAPTPASYINVAASPGYATGQWTAGNLWQEPVSGSSAMPSLAGPSVLAGAAVQSREQLLATVSTADIALPDPVAYRRDWAHYRIRLTFGTPPGPLETRDIAAPEPPPQPAAPPPPGS